MLLRMLRFVKNNRGQAMVEMALVLPVLLLILCGIIEYGRVFHETLVVTGAAREGARAEIVATGAGEAAARNFAAAINRGGLDVDVIPSAGPGAAVTVTVTNPVPIMTPGMAVFFPSNPVIVRGSAIMR